MYPLITGLFVYLKDIGVTGGRAREFSQLNNHHTAFSMTQSISKNIARSQTFYDPFHFIIKITSRIEFGEKLRCTFFGTSRII